MGAEVEELRLRLRRNGYSVLPNRDKQIYMEGWPKAAQTEENIKSWTPKRRWQATGIRLDNGLAVIDVDVATEPVCGAIMNKVAELFDKWDIDFDAVPIRGNTENEKVAIFVRTEEPFNRLHTSRWQPEGANSDDPAHSVEIFGGLAPRQFGAFGAHTIDRTGEVLVRYEWMDGPTPADTPFDNLPVLNKRQFFDILKAAMAAFNKASMQPVAMSQIGEDKSEQVYDLTDEMEFHCNDDTTHTLEELEDASLAGLRCSASWLEGDSARRTDRCLISRDHDGNLCIWETSSGTTHYRQTQDVAEWSEKFGARLIEKLGEPPAQASCAGDLEQKTANRAENDDIDKVQPNLENEEEGAPNLKFKMPERRPVIDDDDEFNVVVWKLLRLYAHCPSRTQCVIPIWDSHAVGDGFNFTAFRQMFQKHVKVEIGPRGGEIKINPVDAWMSSKQHLEIVGLGMRPDMPRPVYEEEDRQFVNTYHPPAHDYTGGDTGLFFDFMDLLVPNENEREYFLNWLAYKMRYPHVPGPMIVMVAKRHGTGRGTLADILRALFGRSYIASIPFQHVMGKQTQSQYTDWQVDNLIVIVNESLETEGSAYKSKQATYEHLKELVDPRNIERYIVVKSVQSFKAIVCASYLVASNNIDALPLADDDRRTYIIMNGDPAPETFWRRLNAWMKDPANIAALAQLLRDRDTGSYSPYAPPPPSSGKSQMIEANKTELDELIEEVFENLKGEVFTPKQIVNLVSSRAPHSRDLPQNWQRVVDRQARFIGHRIGADKDGPGWRVVVEGGRYATYALSYQMATKWRYKDTDLQRRELLKNGHPEGRAGSNVLNLSGLKGTRK